MVTQGFPVRRETSENFSLQLPVRLQMGATLPRRAVGEVGPWGPAGHCQPGLLPRAGEGASHTSSQEIAKFRFFRKSTALK